MSATKPVSILIADDHVMMLDLWSIVISRESRFILTGKAPSGTIAVDMARSQKPDIVLIDIHMGPIDGFEATRLIRNYSPKSKIIGLSSSALTSFAKKMKSLGGLGFITKCSPFEEIFVAINHALRGNFYYCTAIQRAMQAEEKIYNKNDESALLTFRELEIVDLLKKGCSTRQIAENLQIAFNTVQVHRNNIFRKLNVNNVTSLLHYAHMHGI